MHVKNFWGALREYKNTKTYLNPTRIAQETKTILNLHNYKRTFLKKVYFMSRRLFLMLLLGNYRYALRGIINRLTKFIKLN